MYTSVSNSNFFILLCFSIFCTFLDSLDSLVIGPDSRLINGTDTFPKDHPYQIKFASTIVPTPDFLCTGALIDPEWILTNDQCVNRDHGDEPEPFYPLMAIAGAYGHFPELSWQIREFHKNTSYLHIHPQYVSPMQHDMILVHIFPPFILNEFVQIIEFPEEPDYIPQGNGTLTSWGILDPNHGAFSPVLAEAQVPIQSKEDCIAFYSDQHPAHEKPDFEWNLCAGDPSSPVGVCDGDAGMPLTYFDAEKNTTYLVGVASGQKYMEMPFPPFLPVECTPQNRPDFYTRVSKYRPWIEQVIRNNSGDPTTTERPPVGDKICSQYDRYGIFWEGTADQTVIQACPGNKEGQMRWKCLEGGQFEGQNPNYECNSHWIYYLDQYKISIDFYRDAQPSGSIDDTLSSLSSLLVKNMNDNLNSAIENPELDNSNQFFGPEIPQILSLVDNSIGYINCEKSLDNFVDFDELAENRTKYEFSALGNLLRTEGPWEDLNEIGLKSGLSTEVITLIEKSAFDITSRINEIYLNENKSIVKEFEIENSTNNKFMTGIEDILYESSGPLKFPRNANTLLDSYIELPANWKSLLNLKIPAEIFKDDNDNDTCGDKNQGVKFTGIQLELNSLKEKFGQNLLANDENLILNGDIMTFSVETPGTRRMVKNTPLIGGTIKIKFKLNQPYTKNQFEYQYKREAQKCAYWDKVDLIWKTDGCTINFAESNEMFTMCECDHLTSFAILMGNRIEDDAVLEILTIVLCALSNLALIGTIFILQNDKNKPGSLPPMQVVILTNICICLFVGNIFFIFLHPTYFRDTLSWKLCMTIGILSQYIYTAAFTWMGIFGWHVYRLIIFVFNSSGSYTVGYHAVGYGFPVLLVGLIAAVGQKDAYYNEDNPEFCWLQGDWIWTFLAPVILISIMNITVLAITLKKLMNMNFSENSDTGRASQAKMQRPNIRGFISLSLILGITWVPGFLYIFDKENDTLAKVSAYLFTILNASQGVFIFCLQYSLRLRKLRILKSRSVTVSQIYSKDKSKSQYLSSSSGKFE